MQIKLWFQIASVILIFICVIFFLCLGLPDLCLKRHSIKTGTILSKYSLITNQLAFVFQVVRPIGAIWFVLVFLFPLLFHECFFLFGLQGILVFYLKLHLLIVIYYPRPQTFFYDASELFLVNLQESMDAAVLPTESFFPLGSKQSIC